MLATMLLLLAVQAPTGQPLSQKPSLICREDEKMVGSHIHTGRRCKTAEEWEQEDRRRDQVPPTLQIRPDQGDGLPPVQQPHV
jgi:hypothetical protein